MHAHSVSCKDNCVHVGANPHDAIFLQKLTKYVHGDAQYTNLYGCMHVTCVTFMASVYQLCLCCVSSALAGQVIVLTSTRHLAR